MSVKKEAVIKMQRYCAYQERCHSEVRNKLIALKVYGDDLEYVITELIKEDFLNEQRFAETYSGGKFRIKKWGKQKIKKNLKAKMVSEYCINKGLAVIDDDEYSKTLNTLIKKYRKERKNKDWTKLEMNKKCIQFCQNKGYEYFQIKAFL